MEDDNIMNIDWGTFIISIPVTLIIVGGFLKLAVNKFIDTQFNKRLETHKSELQLILETNKFDFQRKMSDFNLYTNKRHESYMNIYDMYLRADGEIRGLMGLRSLPDYREFGREDLEKRLRSFNLLENVINDFLQKWDVATSHTDKTQLHREINDYIKKIEPKIAKNKLSEAKNYYLTRRIYLSEEVCNLLESLTTNLSNYAIGVEFLFNGNIPFTDRQSIDLLITNDFSQLQTKMTTELQAGYYK
jgi:hypothetical protein